MGCMGSVDMHDPPSQENARAAAVDIHHACMHGHLEDLRLCLKHRPETTNQQTLTGETPIVLAAKYNQPECVKLLLQSACILSVARGYSSWQWAKNNCLPETHSNSQSVNQDNANKCLELLTEAFKRQHFAMVPIGENPPRAPSAKQVPVEEARPSRAHTLHAPTGESSPSASDKLMSDHIPTM
eukprot:TRINITY_DN7107_c0_g1_i5.p1 TRINITY_DN7107_c0_g1~~TRINITY_DN7107_c0_g1_i5.p1  ORF type:complete len:184 (-),score=23.06 TRINITY_DN7107_c0_g1_i5:100-651(-)